MLPRSGCGTYRRVRLWQRVALRCSFPVIFMTDVSSREEHPLRTRFSSYRPVFDRIFFGVALLGVLVAVHLLIQQGRGFDRGCLGFSAPEAAAQANTFNCELVTQSGAGTLLGLSNAWWGIVFYLAVAGVSAAAAFTRQRFRMAAVRALLVTGGLLYSAYLTYHQFASLGALCALCLTSGAIALTLFLVQATMLVGPTIVIAPGSSHSPVEPSSSMTISSQFRPARWAGAVLVLLVLIGADVAYFSSLETASAAETASSETAATQTPTGAAPAQGTAAPDEATAPGEASPSGAGTPTALADTTEGSSLPPGCRFAPNQESREPGSLVSFSDSVFGTSDAPVTVVEFFDPNCPHCKTFHSTMETLIAQYGDQARFVYKPIPLWRRSVNQIAALHAAARQGKFKAMLEAQFEHQQQGGLTNDQLADIARQIGMNPDAMLSEIRQNSYQQQIMQDRQLAKKAGVSGTPAVAINGQLVARRARTPQCVTALLQREIEQRTGAQSGS